MYIFMSKQPNQFSHRRACILISELHHIQVTFSLSLKGLRTSVSLQLLHEVHEDAQY